MIGLKILSTSAVLALALAMVKSGVLPLAVLLLLEASWKSGPDLERGAAVDTAVARGR